MNALLDLDFHASILPSLKAGEVMLPYVLDEALICLFKYWDQGIHLGMFYGHELYTHVHSYPPDERLRAYAVAFEQSENNVHACITVSKRGYGVWICLRSRVADGVDPGFIPRNYTEA